MKLTLYDTTNNNELLIWACECRNSDNIMVITGDSKCSDQNDMFNDKAYKTAKYFDNHDYKQAVNYVFNIIKKQFDKNFLKEYKSNFQMYKSIIDIQRINDDAKDLTYDDYHELATFEDVNSGYFCDLIIDEGKVGLRYSKYDDKYVNEFDNISFEEWKPDLTNDVTLMLGMQQKLREFVEKEIDHQIEMGVSI